MINKGFSARGITGTGPKLIISISIVLPQYVSKSRDIRLKLLDMHKEEESRVHNILDSWRNKIVEWNGYIVEGYMVLYHAT